MQYVTPELFSGAILADNDQMLYATIRWHLKYRQIVQLTNLPSYWSERLGPCTKGFVPINLAIFLDTGKYLSGTTSFSTKHGLLAAGSA
ncbi:hypothetical protein VTP01DRAFT_1651 [Rhizomucor pusillus]|uniref:uncharacterized protein n=1 Tax=Rhizomucor pusillus TaxID=4840 RepID=UPI003742CBB4